MAIFVINEWLWADSLGTNRPQAQRETFEFITRLPRSPHRIVFIEGSAFDKKAWSLCKATDATAAAIARAFVLDVRQNSDCCLILKPGEVVDLPAELASSTKADDHYLLQVMLRVDDAILVTTDHPLREAVLKVGLACLSRDEFLRTYF